MTSKLVSALNRTNTSDESAMHIISAAIISSIGKNPKDYNLSYSTIHNTRIKLRKNIALNIKNMFEDNQCLVIHWDTKLLTSLRSSKVERLAIIAFGVHVEQEQLLSVPMIDEGTGVKQVDAIHGILKEWNLVNSVKAFCFDTTSVNIGKFLHSGCFFFRIIN